MIYERTPKIQELTGLKNWLTDDTPRIKKRWFNNFHSQK